MNLKIDEKINTYVYFFPTFFTIANMFCGFYSIILSIKGNFIKAAWLIILGVVFDGIDGAIARAKKIESFLGTELDSLADFITFCIAPIILLWQLIMYRFSTEGIVVCFLYIVSGGIRLARFNIANYNKEKSSLFIDGLPTPAAAGFLISLVFFMCIYSGDLSISKTHVNFLFTIIPWLLNFLPGITLILSILMMTKIRYPKVNIKITKRVSLKLFSLIIVIVLLILAYPETSIFLIFSIYILWGLFEYLYRVYRIRKSKYDNN